MDLLYDFSLDSDTRMGENMNENKREIRPLTARRGQKHLSKTEKNRFEQESPCLIRQKTSLIRQNTALIRHDTAKLSSFNRKFADNLPKIQVSNHSVGVPSQRYTFASETPPRAPQFSPKFSPQFGLPKNQPSLSRNFTESRMKLQKPENNDNTSKQKNTLQLPRLSNSLVSKINSPRPPLSYPPAFRDKSPRYIRQSNLKTGDIVKLQNLGRRSSEDLWAFGRVKSTIGLLGRNEVLIETVDYETIYVPVDQLEKVNSDRYFSFLDE